MFFIRNCEGAEEACVIKGNPLQDYEAKVIEMWESFDENERALVRIGVFPNRQMTDAEEAGYETHPLVVALMRYDKEHRR